MFVIRVSHTDQRDGVDALMSPPEPYPETWGPDRFGDPCRECGLDWSFTVDEAVAVVTGIPDAYENAIGSADGSLRHPDLEWNLGAYVCHVADNLHIWSQWLAGAALWGELRVPGYEEGQLGAARFYLRVPVRGALWQLRQATSSWRGAVAVARAKDVTLQHETRGSQSIDDVARSNAHDAFHHGWDIARIIDHATDRGC
jgi:hypothetical protein